MKRSLTQSDERLAQAVAETRPKKESGRKYRCTNCGVMYPADELTPEIDENGVRTGWACESCY